MAEKSDNPLRSEKRRKLNELKAFGINPFPYSFDRNSTTKAIIKKYSSLGPGEKVESQVYTIAGRLMTKRPMGKAAFFNVQDQSGNLQVYLQKDKLSEVGQKSYELIDIGDFVGIEGTVFKTRKGELSILCQKFEILCKGLEPLPEKFHGLQDKELKYRHRHLDLITNEKSKNVFITRSKIIKEIRNYLDDKGFLEVETPVLQPIYGGAAAYPFSTHHKALDMKLYMKISPELYLKRLIVGGFEKVYEIGKNFRNEGIDRTHNPEFTMLEWYEAYTDYNYQMDQFEDLISKLALKITGNMKVTYQEKEIDFTPPWRKLTVNDGVKEYAGINPEKASDEELFKRLKELSPGAEKPQTRGELIMEIFEESAEEHLWQPTFVIDHPEEISPLTKIHRDKKGVVERFEPFAACMEIGNAYSELNDPIDQERRLQEQEAKRVVDNEAQPMDHDFLHAIDVGMPPTGGVGLGVERIIMLLTDSTTIRDVILFPTMKHKN